MKTDIDIKDVVYRIVSNSELANLVTGIVSKTKRPNNSEKEDIVISVLANINAQDQNAFVNVNIYVKDLVTDTSFIENTIRLRELCRASADLFDVINDDDYRITLDSQRVLAESATNEHFINNKLLYRTLNE